jgi:hypothetical protein
VCGGTDSPKNSCVCGEPQCISDADCRSGVCIEGPGVCLCDTGRDQEVAPELPPADRDTAPWHTDPEDVVDADANPEQLGCNGGFTCAVYNPTHQVGVCVSDAFQGVGVRDEITGFATPNVTIGSSDDVWFGTASALSSCSATFQCQEDSQSVSGPGGASVCDFVAGACTCDMTPGAEIYCEEGYGCFNGYCVDRVLLETYEYLRDWTNLTNPFTGSPDDIDAGQWSNTCVCGE